MKLFSILVLFFFNACGQWEGEQDQGSSDITKGAEIRFLTPWDGEDGMTLFAQIDGTDHLIQDEIRNFANIPVGLFAERGIPENAILAATFLEVVDSKKDYQGVYVIRDEAGPKIYRGFYVPGLGSEVKWEEVPLQFD